MVTANKSTATIMPAENPLQSWLTEQFFGEPVGHMPHHGEGFTHYI